MKKDWIKKCTCENFQQNGDCEHIGNEVLEEVGLGVGDKDCPDCLPYDGCAKHYIKNGDRHDRVGLGEPVKLCPNCKADIYEKNLS